MDKSKITNNSKCLKLCAVLLFPVSLLGGSLLSKASLDKKAQALSADYVKSYNETVTLENSSFELGSKPYTSSTNLSGWTPIEIENKATGMLIDVGSGEMSDGNESTVTFSKHQNTYMLNANPECKDNDDSRILMINSKANIDQHHVNASKGYRSSSVPLAANSYYSFKVAVRTMLNGDDDVSASVYISGLKDLNGEDLKIGIENISPNSWTDYYLFVATGAQAQTVTMDLYLGSANGAKSQGAVFFDDCNIERYSENLFYDIALKHGYNFVDNANSFSNDTVFLVGGLKTLPNYINNIEKYNFDFEGDVVNGLGEGWSEISKANAHAKVLEVSDMSISDFYSETGFNYIGDDLSYQFSKKTENSKSLVMWTGTNSGYSSSYVGVRSQDIEISAHTSYKVSLKLKISEMKEGSFYLKVTENDAIYTLYPSIFSADEESDSYFPLQSQKTNGYSSNTSNNWTNDYQTISFYIKGYNLYNSSVNLELWLGDKSTNANGCVVIDNISVEKTTTKEFESATDKLELKSYTGTPSGFSNALFNDAESKEVGVYPLSAKNWTSTTENDNYNESGILYIGKDDEYKTMYAGKYDWAGISPKSKNGAVTNNVYMMFNRQNSYQSLKSSNYSLSKGSFYKVSFDYYNQLFASLNPSEIKVEIIDENGITLFSQDGLSSIDTWNTMEIYLHTAEMVSHNIQIVIHLGEKDAKVGGMVYLDNFNIEESNEMAFAKAQYNSDLSDYFLSLETNGKISSSLTSSPAFDFNAKINDNGYQGTEAGAEGGIVNGQENEYGIVTETSNFLVLSTKVASEASLTSKYKFAFVADNYYKLTFDLATIFSENAKDVENSCYGVSIKMDGFDIIKELITDGELKSYTILLKCNKDKESTFTFSLISDCENTIGTALLTNFNIVSSNSDEFTSANTLADYNKTLFTSNQEAVIEDEPEEDEDTNTTTQNDNSKWLLIPSIIMGVALIIGIVGYALRKIKIKKINKIKKENYDRKISLDYDVIKAQAKQRRDKEVENLQNTKKALKEEKARLELEHKEYVRESRISSKGRLTREMEKTFKKYNRNVAIIDEKINIIKEKIDNVMTAEYLLSLEHKIVTEEENKFNAEKRLSKEKKKRYSIFSDNED